MATSRGLRSRYFRRVLATLTCPINYVPIQRARRNARSDTGFGGLRYSSGWRARRPRERADWNSHVVAFEPEPRRTRLSTLRTHYSRRLPQLQCHTIKKGMATALRTGDLLQVRGESLPFSFWPLRRGERRWGRHSMVFTSDPWAVIDSSLTQRCPRNDLEAAQSFVRQAREYHTAADAARSTEAQPLLYYYGFLNLAKALALASGRTGLVGRVEHGLQVEDLASPLMTAQIKAFPTRKQRQGRLVINAFDEFNVALAGSGLTQQVTYPVADITAQILFGHRLWAEASRRKERFIGLDRIEIRHTPDSKQVWVNLVIPERALVWRGRSKASVISDGDLAPDFDYVRGAIDDDSVPLWILQQVSPVAYGHRPSDDLMTAIELVKPRLWRAMTAGHPFRRYYVYLSDPAESRLRQPLSVYALMFYLGSVTRYNPPLFREMIEGRYGAFIREFIHAQPKQFVYSVACEFRQQEVSKASGV